MLPANYSILKYRPDHNQTNDFRDRRRDNPYECRAMTISIARNTSLHLAIGCDIKNALASSGIETQPGPTRQEVIDGARKNRVLNFSLNPKYYLRTLQDDDNLNGLCHTFSYCTNCLWKGIPRVKSLCPMCGRFNKIRPAQEDDEDEIMKVITHPPAAMIELKATRTPALNKNSSTSPQNLSGCGCCIGTD